MLDFSENARSSKTRFLIFIQRLLATKITNFHSRHCGNIQIIPIMDVKNLSPDLKKLGSHLETLEETLQPLIDNLPEMSSELPLLDKAKLMTLTAYSIESLLFCKITKFQAHRSFLTLLQPHFACKESMHLSTRL